MNTIEIIGYIAIYLLVGRVLWPIGRTIKKHYKKDRHTGKHIFIILWPFALTGIVAFLWIDGWSEEDE